MNPEHAAPTSKAAARRGAERRLQVDGGRGQQAIGRRGAEHDDVELAGLHAGPLHRRRATRRPRASVARSRLGDVPLA